MKDCMLLLIVAGCFIVSGCAGRDPNPIEIMVPGDAYLTCDALDMQIDFCDNEMKRLEPHCSKLATNTFWFLFFTPLMDVKEAEKVEYDAYSRRMEYLKSLKINCSDTPGQPSGKKIVGYIVEERNGGKVSIPKYSDGSKGEARPLVIQ